ncbi:Alpha/Beta hydrolase protein [Chaetomium sp. MPI-CAGE-AT-0009]|nr:Alpha/Beta hydrolase protein [Chaetomium sp. MPI-CAGE-AT-0009]
MQEATLAELLTTARIKHNIFEIQENYDRIDVSYKAVNDTAIETAILIPKSLSDKKITAPIIVQFHRGGLIIGSNWEPAWLRELPVAEDTVLVSPAYRLAPKAKIGDILEDVSDFWNKKWPSITADLNRILTVGAGAGGYLALQSAFLFNTHAKIKAVIAQYPAIYPDIPSFSPHPAEVDPTLDSVIDDYINNIKPGAVRTQSPYPELGRLGAAIVATGRFRDLWGSPEDLRITTLEYTLSKAEDVPPIWIIQGAENSLVARTATDELVDRLQKAHQSVEVKYTVRPGGHWFNAFYNLSSGWVKDGLSFVKKFWLGKY